MTNIETAFIGGSGLYKVPNLKKIEWKLVTSSFENRLQKFVLDC